MRLNKSMVMSVVICTIVMCMVIGLTFCIEDTKKERTADANVFHELLVSVEFPAEKVYIKPWENEEGILLYFLPSGTENNMVRFANLASDSSLQIGTIPILKETSLLDTVQLEEVYEAEFVSAEGNAESRQIMFAKSESVATLFLETKSGSMDDIHADKNYREDASVTLFDKNGQITYSNDIEYIKARGNSTFVGTLKKSYQIKLNKAAEILGMPSAEKWILLANAIDYTLIKNELVFRFTEKFTSIPTIKGEYVDLYLNGEYAGNYYLCEKVEMAENRLTVTDLESATETLNYERDYHTAVPYLSEDGTIKAVTGLKNPEDITGGYLIEHVPIGDFEGAVSGFQTKGEHYYVIHSPKTATKEQVEYLCNLFNEMEAAIEAKDGVNPETGKHYSDYLDVDSWAMKYLIEEAFSDGDAAAASAFFYKDSDKVDTHLYAGPMWDYDRTLGSYGLKGDFKMDDPNVVRYLGVYAPELMAHEEMQSKLAELLEDCLIPYVDNLMQADVYHLREEIGQSAHLNRMRWKEIYGYYSDYEAATDYLTVFLKTKSEHLRKVWSEGAEYCTVTFLDYYGNPTYVYSVEKGKYLENVPDLANLGFIFNGWYSVEDGLMFDSRLPVMQDITYESRWIGIDILLANGLQMLQNAAGDYSEIENWTQIPPEALEILADYLRQVQSGQEAVQ